MILGELRKSWGNKKGFNEFALKSSYLCHLGDPSSISKRLQVFNSIFKELLVEIEDYLVKIGSNKAIPFTFIHGLSLHCPGNFHLQQKIIKTYMNETKKPVKSEFISFFEKIKDEEDKEEVEEEVFVPFQNDEEQNYSENQVLELDQEEEDLQPAQSYVGNTNWFEKNFKCVIKMENGKVFLKIIIQFSYLFPLKIEDTLIPLSVVAEMKKNEIIGYFREIKKQTPQDLGMFEKFDFHFN